MSSLIHLQGNQPSLDLNTVSAEERAEQLRLLYQAFPQTVWGTVVNALILAFIQWPVTNSGLLIGWALTLFVITAARFALYTRYRKASPVPDQTRLWERRFLIGSTIAGMAWGSTAVLLFPADDFVHQIFLVVVLLAVNAGATTNLSFLRAPIIAYLLVCLTPVIIRFFSLETSTTSAIAAVLIVYLIHLLVSSNGIYKSSLQTIKLNKQARIREDMLTKALERQELHVSQTPLGMIEWDPEFRVLDWNPAAEAIFGYQKEEVLGKSAAELILIEETQARVEYIWQELLHLKGGLHSRNENTTRDGRKIICEWHNTPLVENDGSVVGVVSMVEDVTQRAQAEDQLFREKERAQITLNAITDGVLTSNAEGNIEFMNHAAEQITGWALSEAQGHPLHDIYNVIDKHSNQPIKDPFQRCLKQGTVIGRGMDSNLLKRNGQVIPVEDSAAPLRNREGEITGAVLVFRDISDNEQLRHQLSYQASHDNVTGLRNRRNFEHLLGNAILMARQRQIPHVMFYMDLDQFKIINDTCGHIAGDELLRELSDELKSHMRNSDYLARLGGDEFGVLLENCSLENAEQIANNLRMAIREFRFTWMEQAFEVGVSIGVVGINEDSGDLASILSAADMACYRAKEMGRNRIHIYSDADMDLVQHHGEMQYVSQIKKAIDEDRLCLYGQAIQPVWSGHASNKHYEVLLRMIDEKGELVPPNLFLPAAERYNLMPTIDRWVIEHLFTSFHIYDCGKQDCQFSINLSGTSLSDDEFLDFIRSKIFEHDVPPENITFEITETAAIENLGKAVEFITQLKSIGCRFSLDDFGSGVSSFAYLKNLPVDYLKIDGSFVKDMVNDATDWAMVEAITKIGHVMGLQTIAEFVESEEILKELRKIGVDYAQGYGLGKPAPLAELFVCQPEPPDNKTDQGETQKVYE